MTTADRNVALETRLATPEGDALFPRNLSGFAARHVAQELLANWADAIRDGNTDNLLADVDHVIVHLRHFRQNARQWLPEVNVTGQAAAARNKADPGDTDPAAEAADVTASGLVSIQDAWIAAGGNPGITPTREELFAALRLLDQVCDDVDASSGPEAARAVDNDSPRI